MKKTAGILLLSVLSWVLPLHLAEAKFDLVYLKAQLGLPMVTDGTIDGTDIDTDVEAPYPITVGLGAFISPLFSLALEINYETAKVTELPSTITDDNTKQFGALLNLYFHFPEVLSLEPFIGGGLGYALVRVEENDLTGDGSIWQLSAGFDLNLSEFIALTAEARFLEPIDISLTDENDVDVGDFDYTNARFLVGLKFKL